MIAALPDKNTDFQIDEDLFQNESFCTSLEHLSNTWETFLLCRTSFGLNDSCGTSRASSKFSTK